MHAFNRQMDKATFLANHPAYGYDGSIDDIYQKEFSNRVQAESAYLDHAGTTLYTQSQLNAHFQQLQTLTLNNPHSEQEDSPNLLLIDECIESILSIFETSTRDYSLIFTLNTTHACQLLASFIPFTSNSEYAYMIDSHNSLIGIRQQVTRQGGSCSVVNYPRHLYQKQSTDSDEDWSFRSAGFSPSKPSTQQNNSVDPALCLFAIPAENNFNGLRPPLEMLLRPFLNPRLDELDEFPIPVHHRPCRSHRWLTLVDCAKYLSTKAFSLSVYPVDFLVLSFYKIFGYPTGLGALIMRNESLQLLNKDFYFGGGSVQYISPFNTSRVEYKPGIEGFIHGTIPFTTILALRHGLQLITQTLSYRRISLHTQCLIEYCRYEMLQLSYSNGQDLCLFYDGRSDRSIQRGYSYGPILNFNLYNSIGQFLSSRLIQRIAADHQIILRVGTFCAPGASQAYLGSSKAFEQHEECRRGLFCGSNREGEDVIDSGHQPLGSIRLSLGWMSRYEDITKWIDFLRQVILQGIGATPLSPPLSIHDEHDEAMPLILTDIYVYPVKSCGAFAVKEWPLTSMSLLYDREWMIVDQHSNPLTLKRLPALSQIKPSIDLKENRLILHASNVSPFVLQIDQDSKIIKSSIQLKDGLTCHVYGGDIELWLMRVLGIYATLARRTDQSQVTLANEGAFLLVYEESVREIRSKLTIDENVTHARFRPNLVIDKEAAHLSPPAYSEDTWQRLSIANDRHHVEWTSAGLCQRCSVVNVDPTTGKNQSRLFTRLQTERREINSLRANFGLLLNLSQQSNHAIIRVGDRIDVFQ